MGFAFSSSWKTGTAIHGNILHINGRCSYGMVQPVSLAAGHPDLNNQAPAFGSQRGSNLNRISLPTK